VNVSKATLRDSSVQHIAEVWLLHGTEHAPALALYGDDGEMSCNACLIDFKREPVGQIMERLFTYRQKKFAGHLARIAGEDQVSQDSA
jgi:hypothetical protein